MEVVVSPDVDRFAAAWLERRWNEINVLGLATGSTPERLYGWLTQRYYDGAIRFDGMKTFNLDEYYGLAPNHEQSYRATIHRQLIQYVDLEPMNAYVPPGLTPDVEAACAVYEAQIAEAGGVDVWILGIGHEGHVAFNEKPSGPETRTRLVELSESTIYHNARFFDNDLYRVPRKAVTVGVGTILEARSLLLLAKGDEKAEPVADAVLGEQTEDLPASWLQGHASCVAALDYAAGSELLSRVPGEGEREFESASGVKHTLRFDGFDPSEE